LEFLLSNTDRRRLKKLIASHDRELDDENLDGGSSTTSFNSFHEDFSDTIELALLNSSWSQRRGYRAMIVGTSHPSFLVLHLYPLRRRKGATAPPSEHAGKEMKVRTLGLDMEWIGGVVPEVESPSDFSGSKVQTMRERLELTDWSKTVVGPVSNGFFMPLVQTPARPLTNPRSIPTLSSSARVLASRPHHARRARSQHDGAEYRLVEVRTRGGLAAHS
jgi:hypothetical protein